MGDVIYMGTYRIHKNRQTYQFQIDPELRRYLEWIFQKPTETDKILAEYFRKNL